MPRLKILKHGSFFVNHSLSCPRETIYVTFIFLLFSSLCFPVARPQDIQAADYSRANCGYDIKKEDKEINESCDAARKLTVHVRSEGCADKNRGPGCGMAKIIVNGQDYSKRKRGYNFVVLNGTTGEVKMQTSFDTHLSRSITNNMITFLSQRPPNEIILVAIQDEGSKEMFPAAYDALRKIGAVEPMSQDARGSFALIGFSGPGNSTFVKQVANLRAKGPSIIDAVICVTVKCRQKTFNSCTLPGFEDSSRANIGYDIKKKGHRLKAAVYKYIKVLFPMDCAAQCFREFCCRSANFRNIPFNDGRENCEFLHALADEESENLERNDNYDYLVVGREKSFNCKCFREL